MRAQGEPWRDIGPDPEVKPAGLLLAGGASRRMGRPKAELPIAGRTLLADRWEVLRQVADPVWVSRPYGSSPSAATVVDEAPDLGPLGGIIAGLERLRLQRREFLLVLAVDMPAVSAVLLRRVYAARAVGGVAAVGERPGGQVQPLVSCWHVDALLAVRHQLRAGEQSVATVIQQLPHRVVWLAPNEQGWLVNLNTVAEWEAWRAGHGR